MKVLFQGTGPYPTGRVIGPGCWPHHDLLIVSRGMIALTVAGEDFELEEGDGIVIPPGSPFSGAGRSADAAIWVVHYRGRPPGTPARILEPRRKPVLIPRAAEGPFARALLAEIAAVRARDGLTRYLSALVAALFVRVTLTGPEAEPPDRWKERLLPAEAIEEAPRRVAQFAREAGLSGSHYRARFRLAFGENPRGYLRHLRIKKAQTLLAESQLPIKKIAEQTGYADVAAFHRAFCALTGMTPGRYRRSRPRVA